MTNSNERPPSGEKQDAQRPGSGRPLGDELKSALEGAWSAVERLGRHFVTGDSPEHELADLRRALGHADHVAESLLEGGRAESREQPALDVNGLVSLIELNLRDLLDSSITLSVQLAEPGGIVFANANEIDWIVRSLAEAAVDAMPNGGDLNISTGWLDHASCRALRDGVPPRRYVRLTIGDTGPGRSRETWKRAMEPRPAELRTRTIDDSVSAVVGRLGGSLIFENASATGSRVHVCLPAAHDQLFTDASDSPPDDAA